MARHEETIEKEVPAKIVKRKKIKVSCDLCPKTINPRAQGFMWCWGVCQGCKRDCCPDCQSSRIGELWAGEDLDEDSEYPDMENCLCKECQQDLDELSGDLRKMISQVDKEKARIKREWKAKCAARRVKESPKGKEVKGKRFK